MRALAGLLAILCTLALLPASSVQAQSFPYCEPGQRPEFRLGFAELKAKLGIKMGQPLECEHEDPTSGDMVQRTTLGLAVYRKATSIPAFTNGYRGYALTPQGIVTWEGPAVDPPGVEVAAPPPSSPLKPIIAPPTLRAFGESMEAQLNAYWGERLPWEGAAYHPPSSVAWFRDGEVHSACGPVSEVGPAYCRLDQMIVLPELFFEPFWPRQSAAIALVIAHEWAHHVQNLMGIMQKRVFSIEVELQADCLAGNFLDHARERGWLATDGVHQGVELSYEAGDTSDFRVRGAHGSGEQRITAFVTGYSQRGSCWEYTKFG